MSAPFPTLLTGLAIILALAGCAAAPHAPVAAGPCPAWVNYPADLHSNDGSAYLGCTNAANLAQMLDNKADLAKGRALAPANGAREAKAVQDYEEGKTKSSTGGGSTSTGAGALLQGTGETGPQ